MTPAMYDTYALYMENNYIVNQLKEMDPDRLANAKYLISTCGDVVEAHRILSDLLADTLIEKLLKGEAI